MWATISDFHDFDALDNGNDSKSANIKNNNFCVNLINNYVNAKIKLVEN